MSIYKYQPFYRYNGVTSSQPFREELNQEEIESNINSFFSNIENYFENGTASFRVSQNNCLEITTDTPKNECDERVKKCLNSLDLYSHKTCND